MSEIGVILPDGSPLKLPAGATGADAAAAIGPRLAADALGIKVDGELRDLGAELPDGAAISIVTAKSKGEDADDALWLIRHDAAHVMATAVIDLWPGTKVSIGPPIADGFYYDFEFPEGERPSEADLERIEAAMREHIAADEPFERTRAAGGRGDRALPRRGPAVQGRADRGPGPRRGRRDRLAVPQRPVHRPLPRPARAVDRADQGVQAELARRRLLARRREPPDADPDLRHRLSLAGRPRRAIWSGSSRRASTTTAASARSSICSGSARRRRGCRSGCRTGPCCCG